MAVSQEEKWYPTNLVNFLSSSAAIPQGHFYMKIPKKWTSLRLSLRHLLESEQYLMVHLRYLRNIWSKVRLELVILTSVCSKP